MTQKRSTVTLTFILSVGLLSACTASPKPATVRPQAGVKRLAIGQVYTLFSGQNTNHYNRDDGDYFKLVDQRTWIEIQRNFSANGAEGEYPTLTAEVGNYSRKGKHYQFIGRSQSVTLTYATKKEARNGHYYQIEKSSTDYTKPPMVGLAAKNGRLYYGHYPVHTAHGDIPSTITEILHQNVLDEATAPQ